MLTKTRKRKQPERRLSRKKHLAILNIYVVIEGSGSVAENEEFELYPNIKEGDEQEAFWNVVVPSLRKHEKEV